RKGIVWKLPTTAWPPVMRSTSATTRRRTRDWKESGVMFQRPPTTPTLAPPARISGYFHHARRRGLASGALNASALHRQMAPTLQECELRSPSAEFAARTLEVRSPSAP